jgi:hypothetical protein
MGQKCSCFDKETETKLEKNDFSDSYKKENIMQEENFKNAKEANILKKNYTIDFYIKNGKSSSSDNHNKLEIIIRNISSWFFRKKFNQNIRKSLEIHSEKLFKELFASESIKNLNKIKEKIKNNYDYNGWKEFYEKFPLKFEDLPNSKFQNYYDYNFKNENFNLNQLINNNNLEDLLGITYQRKLIFINPVENNINNNNNKEEIRYKQNFKNLNENNVTDKDKDKDKDKKLSFIYIGNVNKFGERHGKGIMYQLEGSLLSSQIQSQTPLSLSISAISMEEGIWYNNYLIGWVRKILSSGIFYDCKIIYKIN